jgi:hypothetical protein
VAAEAVQQNSFKPATVALVASQAALHFRPCGYRALQVQ